MNKKTFINSVIFLFLFFSQVYCRVWNSGLKTGMQYETVNGKTEASGIYSGGIKVGGTVPLTYQPLAGEVFYGYTGSLPVGPNVKYTKLVVTYTGRDEIQDGESVTLYIFNVKNSSFEILDYPPESHFTVVKEKTGVNAGDYIYSHGAVRIRFYSPGHSMTSGVGYHVRDSSVTIFYNDIWDPDDDIASSGTVITVSTYVCSSGEHFLDSQDIYDWFRVYMTTSTRYHFYTSGTVDNCGELYMDEQMSVLVSSDDNSNINNQFKIIYEPQVSTTYYLLIKTQPQGNDWTGTLHYFMEYLQTSSTDTPVIAVNTQMIDFGEVKNGSNKVLSFEITNTGGGILSGTISSNREWLFTDPSEFNGNSQVVFVTADNSKLNKKDGDWTGTITITSNGGNISIPVKLTATCVLVCPNPYSPGENLLKFYGSGIVDNQTVIKIYSISGEFIKELKETYSHSVILWDGKTQEGNFITPGIYIYTFESPEEKGTGKFTVK